MNTPRLPRALHVGLTFAILAATASTQEDWRLVAGFGVATYTGGAMSLEPGGRILRFGGVTVPQFAPTDVTQLWNGTVWTTIQGLSSAPPARTNALLTFDNGRQRAVLHGGIAADGSILTDTWEWDGLRWDLVLTPQAPPARRSAAIAFDGQRVVLFGGQNGQQATLGDTWAYNGTTWQQLSPTVQPTARIGHAMASGPGEILLSGGGPPLSSTQVWRWDGSNWSLLQAVAPFGNRVYPALVHDPVRNRYLMFGGLDALGFQRRDTWQLAAGQWTELPTSRNPFFNVSISSAFHPASGRWVATWSNGSPSPYGSSSTAEFGSDLAYVDGYGIGCNTTAGGSLGPLTIELLDGQPRPGDTAVFRVTTALGLRLLAIGWSDTVAPFGTLPFPLTAIGAGSGCSLWQSTDVILPMPSPVIPLAIPNQSGLIGIEFYVQGIDLGNGTPAELRVSRAFACGIDVD